MEQERRKGQPAIPDHVHTYLTGEQLQTLRYLKNYRCELAFVRRELFQKAVPVIAGTDNRLGVIEEDGEINWHPSISFRD